MGKELFFVYFLSYEVYQVHSRRVGEALRAV